ncbi:unnamed protein product, partial [Effrenium voratum]
MGIADFSNSAPQTARADDIMDSRRRGWSRGRKAPERTVVKSSWPRVDKAMQSSFCGEYLGLWLAPSWGFTEGNLTPQVSKVRQVTIVGASWPRSVPAVCVWAREAFNLPDHVLSR